LRMKIAVRESAVVDVSSKKQLIRMRFRVEGG
jgi:hypothetical protein